MASELLLILQLWEYGFWYEWAFPFDIVPCSFGKLFQYCSVGDSWNCPGGTGACELG